MDLTIRDYFKQAKYTMNPELTFDQVKHHALLGMCSECGEIHGLYQKTYQGHELRLDSVIDELGDLMWFVMELCYAEHIDPQEVLEFNMHKLNQRYPEGFSAERSRNRGTR